MESIFDKDPADNPTPTAYDRIAPEISHLKKASSSRHAPGTKRSAPWFVSFVICALLWLYFMDPFLYALHKSDAIRIYLYLHTYGAGPETNALIASGIFSQDEIATLNRRQGSFQDYFPSPDQAARKATAIVDYMNGLRALHEGNYKQLDPIGKVRCVLFISTGLPLPTTWTSLTPTVTE